MDTAEIMLRVIGLVVASLSAGGALATFAFKVRSDNRAEWWRRYEWATALTFPDRSDYEQEQGWMVLTMLVTSTLKTSTEEDLIYRLAVAITMKEQRKTGEEET